jgi:hypothetical protein
VASTRGTPRRGIARPAAGHAAFLATMALATWLTVGCLADAPDGGPISSPPAAARSAPTAPEPSLCAGMRAWPPSGYPSAPSGITALMTDAVTVRITNSTDRTYWYRISGWTLERLAMCPGIVIAEQESQRGPLPGHAVVEGTIGYVRSLDSLRIGVGIWDHPCGEGCNEAPIGFIPIPRSWVEPIAS